MNITVYIRPDVNVMAALQLFVILHVIFMKWTSVLFSDLRNKLGNQIVGSSWKGRGYFRGYVVPTNPNTKSQQAHRGVNADAVKHWQSEIATDPAAVTAWNTEALSRLISGFNLLVKYARKNLIECDETKSGSSPQTIDGKYTATVDISKFGIIVFKDGVYEAEVKEPGTLSSTPDSPFSYDATSSGTYDFWFIDDKVLDILEPPKYIECCCCHWTPDTVNGVSKAASCEVTIV